MCPEKIDELVGLFGKMAVANWSKMDAHKMLNRYRKASKSQKEK
jgi:hypothetical protein